MLLGIAALGFTVLWFALLTGRPLFDPDEGRYAEIPREMLSGGDWVIPHLNGLAYLEKPPLQYWITALSFRCLGQSEGAARLWTGLTGYLSLAIVFVLGRRLWGFDAGMKALLLTSASTLFVLMGHQLTLDMSLSFCLLAGLACFLTAQLNRGDRRRCRAWMLGCWAAMALAVLTKGLIGVLIPGATLILYTLWQRDTEAVRRLNIRWGLPLFAAIAAPWFVLAARANSEFLNFFFVREHFLRFLTPIEERMEPWWYFMAVLVVGILPWFPEALRSVAVPLRSAAPRGQFDPRRVLWIWCAFVLVFFSLSHSKLIPYILPLVPALALLCASPKTGDGRGSLLAGAILSLGASIGILTYASALWSTEQGRTLALQLRPDLIRTCIVLAVASAACCVLLQRKRTAAALASLCVGWFAAAATILIAAYSAQQYFSAKDVASALRAHASGSAPVYSVQSYEQTLPFYLGQTVVLTDYRDEFALGLSQNPTAGIATLQEFSRRWRSLDEGFAVMPSFTHDRLSAEGLPMREIARYPRELVLVSRR
jgi:4-amino-4-deoxy-L-arabinose transferase-like glycosyltransferase